MGLIALLQRLLLPTVGILAAFAIGGAAFTAANTIPESTAGAGAEAVSGYTITAISYSLNGANPQNIDSVSFTATADNSSTATVLSAIKVRFDSDADYYDCTRDGGTAPAHNISCNTTVGTQLTVADTDTFDAIIVE